MIKIQHPYILIETKQITTAIKLENVKDTSLVEIFCAEAFEGAFCKKGDKLAMRADSRMFVVKSKDKEYKFILENDILAVID